MPNLWTTRPSFGLPWSQGMRWRLGVGVAMVEPWRREHGYCWKPKFSYTGTYTTNNNSSGWHSATYLEGPGFDSRPEDGLFWLSIWRAYLQTKVWTVFLDSSQVRPYSYKFGIYLKKNRYHLIKEESLRYFKSFPQFCKPEGSFVCSQTPTALGKGNLW